MTLRPEQLKRFLDECEKDFVPFSMSSGGTKTEDRSAHALEYIAFQLGRIRQKLEENASE